MKVHIFDDSEGASKYCIVFQVDFFNHPYMISFEVLVNKAF